MPVLNSATNWNDFFFEPRFQTSVKSSVLRLNRETPMLTLIICFYITKKNNKSSLISSAHIHTPRLACAEVRTWRIEPVNIIKYLSLKQTRLVVRCEVPSAQQLRHSLICFCLDDSRFGNNRYVANCYHLHSRRLLNIVNIALVLHQIFYFLSFNSYITHTWIYFWFFTVSLPIS